MPARAAGWPTLKKAMWGIAAFERRQGLTPAKDSEDLKIWLADIAAGYDYSSHQGFDVYTGLLLMRKCLFSNVHPDKPFKNNDGGSPGLPNLGNPKANSNPFTTPLIR